MKRFHSFKLRLRVAVGLAVMAVAIYSTSNTLVIAADKKTADTPKPTAAKKEKQPAKKLDGAELYTIHCNRCHAERYPTERTDAQWKTIMLHMQTRAQLPGKDAKAILKYLQENN
jgi:cytochrome c5